MAEAVAGPLPWTESYSRFAYSGKGSRKAKAEQRQLGFRWSAKNKRWQRNANHGVESAKAKWVDYAFDNRKLLGDLTDEYKKTRVIHSASGAADYVDYSFSVDKDHVQHVQGCGHIASLAYNIATLVLKVEFANNGSVVCYFRVPSVVADELIEHAKTKDTGFGGKHLLGMRFWELIRVRYTIHGTRFPFAYTTDNGFEGGTGHQNGARWEGRRVSDQEAKMDEQIAKFGTKGATDADKYEDVMFDEHNLDRSFVTVLNEKRRPITVFRDDANLLSKADRIKLGEAYDEGLDIDQLNELFSKLHNK